MSVLTIRNDLTTALSDSGRVVYPAPPEQPLSPSLVVVPGTPYIEPRTIGALTSRVDVRFNITACVQPLDNNAALNNLEVLMLAVLTDLPDGYAVEGGWSSPTINTVGNTEMLTSQISVVLAATLT